MSYPLFMNHMRASQEIHQKNQIEGQINTQKQGITVDILSRNIEQEAGPALQGRGECHLGLYRNHASQLKPHLPGFVYVLRFSTTRLQRQFQPCSVTWFYLDLQSQGTSVPPITNFKGSCMIAMQKLLLQHLLPLQLMRSKHYQPAQCDELGFNRTSGLTTHSLVSICLTANLIEIDYTPLGLQCQPSRKLPVVSRKVLGGGG